MMRIYTGDHHNDDDPTQHYDMGGVDTPAHGHVDGAQYDGVGKNGARWTLHYTVHIHGLPPHSDAVSA